jgi:putative ABC transport system permease protein
MENLAHDPAGRRTPRPVRPVRATLAAGLVLLAGVVGLFAGTLGLAMQLRERELSLLRAVAATPRQVRRMRRWEAVLLAVGASLAAYLPGIALAGLLNDAFADRGLAPEGMPIAGRPIAGLVKVAATVATALASAWAGSRRASRMAPTRALQEAAVEPRLIGFGRLLSGLVALAGGLAAVAIAGSAADEDTATAAALAASLVLVAGVALLGPLVTRLAALIPARCWPGSRRSAGFSPWPPRARHHAGSPRR